jgi:NADH dehydrogenase
MPGLGTRLGEDTAATLRSRGVEVDLGTSLVGIDDCSARLSDGRVLSTSTVIWAAGVAPSPLVDRLGVPTDHGRLVVGADLAVPGHPEVFALGDAAAVPDLAKGDGAVCPPTAQHAQRQGKVVADNIIASIRGQQLKPYYHKDLGLVVDLGGADAVSKPVGVELTGLPAQLVARGYHLMAMRTNVAKVRVATNWGLNATAGDDFVRTGFQARRPAALKDFEYTDSYLNPDQVREFTKNLIAKR